MAPFQSVKKVPKAQNGVFRGGAPKAAAVRSTAKKSSPASGGGGTRSEKPGFLDKLKRSRYGSFSL